MSRTPKTPQRAQNGRTPQTNAMEVDADEAVSQEAMDLEEGVVEAEDIGREDEDMVVEEDNRSKRKPQLLSWNLAKSAILKSTARKHAQQCGHWQRHKLQLITPNIK